MFKPMIHRELFFIYGVTHTCTHKYTFKLNGVLKPYDDVN